MCKFYTPTGEELTSAKAFVEYYAPIYYLDNPTELEGANHRPIGKTNRAVENRIEEILKNGIQEEKDLIQILAWKMGKIKQSEVQNEMSFVYHSDWENAETHPETIMRYGNPLQIEKLLAAVRSHLDQLKKAPLQEALNQLEKDSVRYIGTVYLITLLYFITGAEYPIYDQFAKKAVDAIKSGAKPGDKIVYVALPSKDTKEFQTVGETLQSFKKDICEIFGYENYKASRDIDRALWVYGHLFDDSKNSSAC